MASMARTFGEVNLVCVSVYQSGSLGASAVDPVPGPHVPSHDSPSPAHRLWWPIRLETGHIWNRLARALCALLPRSAQAHLLVVHLWLITCSPP